MNNYLFILQKKQFFSVHFFQLSAYVYGKTYETRLLRLLHYVHLRWII